MSTLNHRAASAAAAFISVAVLVAGCSSGKGSSGGGKGASSSGSASAVPSSSAAGGRSGSNSSASQGGAAVATAVTATEQEFSLTLSTTTFKAGPYTFTVHNAGKFAHNLTIEGPGVDRISSPTTPGGGTATVRVTLARGAYELWCSVDSHKDKGMDMMITVT